MELKTNETNYSYDAGVEKSYPNPNDTLFGDLDVDTPYKITSTYTNTKPQKNNTTNIIVSVVIVIICIGVIGLIYAQRHKFDGTYKLDRVEVDGVEYSTGQIEAALFVQLGTHTTYDSEIKINGKKALVSFNITGMMEEEFDTPIYISGNTIEFKHTSPRLYGDYDPDTKEIYVEVNGNALIYEKVD